MALALMPVASGLGQSNLPGNTSSVPAPSGVVYQPTTSYPQSTQINYVRVSTAKSPISSIAGFENLGPAHIGQTTEYIDGLGRPVQTVNRQASPGSQPRDIVTPVEYDDFGRQKFSFLPYVSSTGTGLFRATPFSEQSSYLSGVYPGEQVFYNRTEFDQSPLNRTRKTFAPGNSWGGSFGNVSAEKCIKTDMASNTVADDVKLWNYIRSDFFHVGRIASSASSNTQYLCSWSLNPIFTSVILKYRISGSSGGWTTAFVSGPFQQNYTVTLSSASLYEFSIDAYQPNGPVTVVFPDNSSVKPVLAYSQSYPEKVLFKHITEDEHGNKTVEFKDKDNRVLLKRVQLLGNATDGHTGWLNTYYIYDQYDRLRCVLSPKATKLLLEGTPLSELLDELCFLYEYDVAGRMTGKKVPGAGWVYMIYDKRDRLVFTQDAKMRNSGQWMTTLYDPLNRPVLVGMITNSGSRQALQDYVNLNTGTNLVSAVSFNRTNTETLPSSLIVDFQQSSNREYVASGNIDLMPGFDTDNGIELLAEIRTAGNTSNVNEQFNVIDNPLPQESNLIALILNYYDDYTWTSKQYQNQAAQYLDAGTNQFAEPVPSSAMPVFRGASTGTRVRVINDPANLANGNWLTNVTFYDQKGRVIQTISDNIAGGEDIVTNRYNFSGIVLSSLHQHHNPLNVQVSGSRIRIKTNFEYDVNGNLLDVFKTINDDPVKKLIVHNEYDDFGKILRKSLGKKTDNSPLEVLDYEYNIRGWLKGVNKDYVSGGVLAPANWFGFELMYDYGFEKNQFNGNIAGTKWKSRGDQEERAYGFGYDRMNRILYADFKQKFGSAWANADPSSSTININFTSIMGNGVDAETAYDENGNIKAMKQWGLKVNSSSVIDDLAYHYFDKSNKLLNVIDASNDPDTKLGDFRSSSLYSGRVPVKTASTQDYSYDMNGNLVRDFNKDIYSGPLQNNFEDGIVYNHLNLPYKIIVRQSGREEFKGNITYIYDAAGNKLQKKVEEYNVQDSKTTTYIGGMVYENNVLQFVSHEEGRIRYEPANHTVNPVQPEKYHYDYFIKDHLGNVRMVLTEEQRVDKYPVASLENEKRSIEETYYGIISSHIVQSNTIPTPPPPYVNDNGIGNNPPDNSFSGQNSNNMYRLNASTNKMGLGITLKVMSGDRIDIFGKSYYYMNNQGGSNANVTLTPGDLLSGFLGSANGANGIQKNGPVNLGDINVAPGIGGILSFLNNQNSQSNTSQSKPRAFINYVFFDEQFKCTGAGCSIVGAVGELKDHFAELQNLVAPKNGYIFVYCSNESPVNVFFDNLQLVHTRSPLVEESHYYPFGLVMSGISSKALSFGNPTNKLKYISKEEQRQEFSDGSGLEWLDFGARMYDNQIGRWMALDSKSEAYYSSSPFNYALNNPIVNFDPNGKWTVSRHHTMTVMALSSAGIGGTQAYWIAHYSAVYADNPGNHLILNNFIHPSRGDIYRREIDYSFTKFSQVTDYPNYQSYNFNVWHSMRSPQEKQRFENGTIGGISSEGAMQRGMEFGWGEVFSAAKSNVKLADLKKNSWQIQSLGQGLHALQDAYAHHGRHDVGVSHIRRDIFESNKAAEGITNSAIAVYALITKDYKSVDKMMEANKGSLGFISTEGMSTQQIVQVFTAIQNYLTDHKPKR